MVESDFQASDSVPTCGITDSASPENGQGIDLRKQTADSPQATVPPTAGQSKPLDNAAVLDQEESLSPPSTPTRKPPFSRGRLRLLSFRSMEEPKPAPSVKEKYPILKHVLDFIKDQSLSHERSARFVCLMSVLVHAWGLSALLLRFSFTQLVEVLSQRFPPPKAAMQSVCSPPYSRGGGGGGAIEMGAELHKV